MKVKNLTSILTNLTGIAVNQSMLAKSLDITRQTICNRIKNDSELTVSELSKIEKYFNVSISPTLSKNELVLDYYPDVFASCGNGAVIFSEEKEILSIPSSIISKYSNNSSYSIIHAKGDSMEPFIYDSDKLIIEHLDGEQIIDNKIYLFCYKEEFFVKRLSKNVDEIIIKSENPSYANKSISSFEIKELNIIGQVVGVIRSV